ncbi:MAG TPA: aldo/keto reductase, partial [Tepidisphaeraceae bacterium]|nr:aldo/keto reductase [Tepidisphaeraceae bacterium]
RWGILGAGAIAKAFVKGVSESASAVMQAVGSRSQDKANVFGSEHSIPNRYGSYEALIADPTVDAIYVCTPHPMHAEWAIKSLRAGKHVLVEKPFSLNHAQAMAIAATARDNNLVALEAFMYRSHPQTTKLYELVKSKIIGDVRVIRAAFSFHAAFNPDSRLFNNDLAGGGILDVGCYPVSIARLIAGAAIDKPFADPIEVKGSAHLGQTGIDEWAVGTLKFPNGILAEVATGVGVGQDNALYLFGSEGRIVVPNPYVANRGASDQGLIVIHPKNGQKYEVHSEALMTAFGYEVDAFTFTINTKIAHGTSPSIADTLGNMKTLDRWRDSVGLTYRQEKYENFSTKTISNEVLRKNPQNKMKYGEIEHMVKPVSRLIMGCDNQQSLAHASAMFDDYFERGGNTFDTAFIYGGGRPETFVGQWLKLRNVRDQVNVIVKGAHEPRCDPTSITTELKMSLERLAIDYADLYLIHRDNVEVPVGEFVDVLNEHAKSGKIKAFGASNWSLARVDEANNYAKSKGLQDFSVVSNNFSLARMVNPIWPGSISTSDPESRAWFAKNQMPLFSWSSQARGFFVPGRASPDQRENKELMEGWSSDDNFERQ